MIIDAQNSIYWSKDQWWDPQYSGKEEKYWGWNEVSFDKGLDDVGNQDALVVVLPNNAQTICDMNVETAQLIDVQLQSYASDSFGGLPVIVARNINNSGDDYDLDPNY